MAPQFPTPSLRFRSRTVHFSDGPLLMGIININSDSFCQDGSLDQALAQEKAATMVGQGAQIIDVGAESARTNRPPISVAEEIQRLLPFVEWFEKWRENFPAATAPLLSINTWRSEVVREILPVGGDLLNDISALPEATNAEICAQHQAALLIMHSIGQPKVSHKHVVDPEIMKTLHQFFLEKIALALSAGCDPEQILIDPGIDFAKQPEANLTIYRDLAMLHELKRPILLPISRKSVIKHTLGVTNPQDRDPGTIASLVSGLIRGAHIFRVHNVAAMADSLKVAQAVLRFT